MTLEDEIRLMRDVLEEKQHQELFGEMRDDIMLRYQLSTTQFCSAYNDNGFKYTERQDK